MDYWTWLAKQADGSIVHRDGRWVEREYGPGNVPLGNGGQVGGTHYQSLKVEPWDAMEAWMTPEQFEGYLLGSAIKYLSRYNAEADGKGGKLDIGKAIHFLEKLKKTVGKGAV